MQYNSDQLHQSAVTYFQDMKKTGIWVTAVSWRRLQSMGPWFQGLKSSHQHTDDSNWLV